MGELVAYFKCPPVIGELIAGVLIGHNVLGWIEDSSIIQVLAHIGIVLLLFEVGIETDIYRLGRAGYKAALVALGGIVLPFLGGFIAAYYFFQFSLLASLFIGATLTATSIGITLRVLRDLHQHNSSEAQIIVGAAVIDDVIGIVILSLLYEFSVSGQVNLWSAFEVLIFIMLFIIIAPIAAQGVGQIIKKWDARSNIPGLLSSAIIALIMLFAWLAHFVGAPELLGGFAAGLALSPQFFYPFGDPHRAKEFSHHVEEQMKPIVSLFTPIFFVSIGMSLDFTAVHWTSSYIWLLTGMLLLIAIVGKMLSGFVLYRETLLKRVIIGNAMVPRGEVGLIFANIAVNSAVFNNETYTAITLVIALTTLVAPFSLRYLYQLQERLAVSQAQQS
jgi:Kef-type K+ transport system membrane component KefB